MYWACKNAQRKALTALSLAGTFTDVPSVHYVCVVNEEDAAGWTTRTCPSGAWSSGTYYATDIWVVAFFGSKAYDDVRPGRARQLEEAKARRGAKLLKKISSTTGLRTRTHCVLERARVCFLFF